MQKKGDKRSLWPACVLRKSISRFLLGGLLLGSPPAVLNAGYLDDIGYTDLAARLEALGIAVPDGTGVTVTQVEASTGTSTGSGTTTYSYVPSESSFTGVTFTNASESSYPAATSSHATTVGKYIYGDDSMGAGIVSVTVYNASDWISSGFLNTGSSGFSRTAPDTENGDVVNHSWVGTTGSDVSDQRILNRLDYSVQRDDYVAVVGVNNGSTSRNLLASAYNVVSVGVTSGSHASGTGSLNSSVSYPQIVVPVSATSYATAVVSSASALLIQTARSSADTSANGAKSEVVKAVLLAGATKGEFSGWSRTDTSPLDATYGAGELNVLNSYEILTAGEQSANGSVAETGWDFHSLSLGAATTYAFDISSSADFSAVLTWNAIYSGTNYDSLSLSLANLQLYLYSVGEGGVLTLVQQSVASGNIEALWATGLSEGSYLIKVVYEDNASGSLSAVDYALAWQSIFAAVPEPEYAGLLGVGVIALIVGIRRRRNGSAGA